MLKAKMCNYVGDGEPAVEAGVLALVVAMRNKLHRRYILALLGELQRTREEQAAMRSALVRLVGAAEEVQSFPQIQESVFGQWLDEALVVARSALKMPSKPGVDHEDNSK